jgi:predicted nucleotidyltransferase
MGKSKIIKKAVTFFKKNPKILAVHLLGSLLRNELRNDSDIDFGILLFQGEKIDPIELLALSNELSWELGRNVDIGLINSKNLVYAKEALLCGEQIYAKDKSEVSIISSSLLAMYLRFNEDRKEVLDAYKAG